MHTLKVTCYPCVDREEPTDFDPLYEYGVDVVANTTRAAIEEMFSSDSEELATLSKGADDNWYAECEDGLLKFELKLEE